MYQKVKAYPEALLRLLMQSLTNNKGAFPDYDKTKTRKYLKHLGCADLEGKATDVWKLRDTVEPYIKLPILDPELWSNLPSKHWKFFTNILKISLNRQAGQPVDENGFLHDDFKAWLSRDYRIDKGKTGTNKVNIQQTDTGTLCARKMGLLRIAKLINQGRKDCECEWIHKILSAIDLALFNTSLFCISAEETTKKLISDSLHTNNRPKMNQAIYDIVKLDLEFYQQPLNVKEQMLYSMNNAFVLFGLWPETVNQWDFAKLSQTKSDIVLDDEVSARMDAEICYQSILQFLDCHRMGAASVCGNETDASSQVCGQKVYRVRQGSSQELPRRNHPSKTRCTQSQVQRDRNHARGVCPSAQG